MKKITLFLVAIFAMNFFSFAQSQMSGTYTVGTGGSYDYSSMADAGMAIKEAEFTGDVTLLICTDLTETINTGIVNKSEYTLTIRPDKDENRTITYTTATDNTGPTGVFVIGGDMTKTPGSTIGWASVPTKNVIVDGAAEGESTPRLEITNEKWGTNVLLYGDVQNVVIKNCILTGRSSGTAYALVFRSEKYANTNNDVAPKNCLVENCVLQSSSSSSQTIYFQGNEANSAAGYPADITIRNCDIKAHTRGMYVRQVKNLTVEGCTIDMSDATAGILAHGILGEKVVGTAIVRGNKFVKNSTKNYYGGSYGLQTITASGGADVWVIENNYFAGYDALSSITNTTNGTEGRLVAVRCGDSCVVRHNTFHMPKLTKTPASALVGSEPTALLWLAGSKQYPVQNNIFICEEETANVSLIRGGLNPNVTGNVFYHNGGNAAIVAGAPSCMTFADLETSYPTQAATSKWKNVTFTDAANGDLSLAGKSNGDPDLAVNRLAEVLTDITGKNRREKTCAGAYEGREPLPSSITLNAHPVKDYSASIVGTMKRAIQNGENTIVLTHEDDGTPHIYNIAHTTKTVTEVSQEGVNAAADGFLSISDIAVTEDGKLVACNYVHCTFTASNTSYFYIWDDLAGDPTVWFTSQKSGNYNDAYMGYTMALKGSSQNAEVTISAFNKSNSNTRYSHLYVVDGTYSDASYKYSRDNAVLHPTTLGKNTYELNASPLADGKWIVDGELASPIEFVEKNAVAIDTYTPLNTNILGKKYNGASYLFHNDHHLMVAPYATDDKLAGVKVLGITDGFDAATLVTTATDLTTAIDATTAAATAYVDGDGDLTIYLIADGKVYTFSEKVPDFVIYNVTATAGEGGTVEGGGIYEEGTTATLTATPAAHHQFVNWIFDDETTSTDNPLELVVNSDIIVTANFKPIQYTLIAPTNDENKGTVSGAGAYNYGTEVTLTATPKPGYKLLYWSDRSTENPRNITMTKNAALSAYFVKNYVVEPTFTIEKVWENTNVPASTNNGYQAVGWDGKIYMKDRLNAAINVYTETSSELYAQLGSAVTGHAGDQPIAVDEAGNLIVRSGSSYFYDSPTQISIFRKDETTPKVIDFTLPVTGRCDFISASGDIYSAKGGYVYFYCMSQTTINRVKIAEGELVSTEVVGIGLPSGQSQSHVMTNIFGNIIAHTKSNNIKEINVHTNQTLSLTLPSNKNTTLGGCSFELAGKELIAYNIAGTDYNSEWNIYNMTDKKFLSNETLYAKDKVSKKVSGAANWLNVQVVDENTAYIYQFCPEVAVAVWKVTMHEVVLRDTENNEDLLTDLNSNTTNVSVYRSLTGGMYNTLCLPFDVNELTGTPLENATVWQYNGATVKGDGTSKEIFLDFAEVTSIAAGEPYLVEPAEDIAAPMEFKDVTISVTNGNDVAQGAVTMHGILHPKELQANDKSILFLVENNNLAWANETANMNGMRAYFKVNEPSLLSARTRAYIRREPTVATDMENITTTETEIKKVIYNNNLYILRGKEIYTIQGTKLK